MPSGGEAYGSYAYWDATVAMDMNMLSIFGGNSGRVRTRAGFDELLGSAGFELTARGSGCPGDTICAKSYNFRHSGVGVSAAGGLAHPQSDHSQGRRARPGIGIIERVGASGSTPDPAAQFCQPSRVRVLHRHRLAIRIAPNPHRAIDRQHIAAGDRTAAALRPVSAADLSSRARSAAPTADRTRTPCRRSAPAAAEFVLCWRADRMIELGHARQAGMGNLVPAIVTECRQCLCLKYRTQCPAG